MQNARSDNLPFALLGTKVGVCDRKLPEREPRLAPPAVAGRGPDSGGQARAAGGGARNGALQLAGAQLAVPARRSLPCSSPERTRRSLPGGRRRGAPGAPCSYSSAMMRAVRAAHSVLACSRSMVGHVPSR